MTKIEFLNEGFRQFAAGRYEDAIELFENALKIDPEYDLAVNALAETYNKLGKIDQAIEMAKKVIELAPKSEDGYILMVHIFWDDQELDKAIEWCEIGLKQTNSELLSSKLERLEKIKNLNDGGCPSR